jgi:D-alanine-D-alanine ligase
MSASLPGKELQAGSRGGERAATPDPRDFGRVGVLFGGRSSERDISLLSGAAVLAALCEAGVDAHAFDPAERSLGELEAEHFARAFLILHGRYGEDGAIQGVLESLRIPYTGSGIRASAIAMDKITTKRIWISEGIPTPRWASPAPGDDAMRAVAALGPRLIVKPSQEGSTFGLTRVEGDTPAARRASLEGALLTARGFGGAPLVEECILGRELTCAILGEGDQARALPLVEILAPNAIYDYHNKYFSDATRYLCPAPVEAALASEISALCLRAYRAVGARGWGRIDVMLGEEPGGPRPWLLELNTAPGMTGHSLVPMAARAAGLDFGALVLQVLAGARLEFAP